MIVVSDLLLSFPFYKDEKNSDEVQCQELMEFVARKFHEMAEVNQEHAWKQVKEAAKFKHKFLELLKTNGNQESAIVNSSSVMLDDETQSCEPVMFEGEDLTKIVASDGPSCFGRSWDQKYLEVTKNAL